MQISYERLLQLHIWLCWSRLARQAVSFFLPHPLQLSSSHQPLPRAFSYVRPHAIASFQAHPTLRVVLIALLRLPPADVTLLRPLLPPA